VQAIGAAAERHADKSATAFRTTGEVAEELALPAHVLRFWESKFPQIRPLKRGGGRRYYRPEDVDLLRRIRQYLHHEGYTIRGVQRLLREGAPRGAPERAAVGAAAPPDLFGPVPPEPAAAAGTSPSPGALAAALADLRRELSAIRSLLAELLAR
jgi:DNA-binding transcriptional MerR regulator